MDTNIKNEPNKKINDHMRTQLDERIKEIEEKVRIIAKELLEEERSTRTNYCS